MAGVKGSSGRKAGTPNKKTEELFEICERLKVNPFEGLCLLARDGDEESTRLKAHVELCKYLYPQRKAIEMSTGEQGFKVVLEDYSSKK